MSGRIEKAVERAKSGKLSRQELESLRKNAIRIGSAEEVVKACEQMLSKLPKPRAGGVKRSSSEIVEKKNGYNIMRSAYNEKGEIIKPRLLLVAEELSTNQLITEISVLKTQLKLYYKGRHFTAGYGRKGAMYWICILDETKITDSTIDAWKEIGKIGKGTYFKTIYVAVEVDDLQDLHTTLECVVFT